MKQVTTLCSIRHWWWNYQSDIDESQWKNENKSSDQSGLFGSGDLIVRRFRTTNQIQNIIRKLLCIYRLYCNKINEITTFSSDHSCRQTVGLSIWSASGTQRIDQIKCQLSCMSCHTAHLNVYIFTTMWWNAIIYCWTLAKSSTINLVHLGWQAK